MSPLQIEMLLHIHARCEPYDDRGGNAQREAWAWFWRDGLIKQVAPDEGADLYGRFWHTTERGAAMVAKLCNVPLPMKHTVWQ